MAYDADTYLDSASGSLMSADRKSGDDAMHEVAYAQVQATMAVAAAIDRLAAAVEKMQRTG